MKMYETGGYNAIIEVVEVVRYTEKGVWLDRKDYKGNVIDARCAKISVYSQYWATLNEAKEYIEKGFVAAQENIDWRVKKIVIDRRKLEIVLKELENETDKNKTI